MVPPPLACPLAPSTHTQHSAAGIPSSTHVHMHPHTARRRRRNQQATTTTIGTPSCGGMAGGFLNTLAGQRGGGRACRAGGIVVVKRTRRRRRNQRATTTIGTSSCGGRMAGGFLDALAGRAGRRWHACGEKI